MPGKQFRCRGDPWSGFAILAASFVIPFRARGREGRRGKGEGGWISERGGGRVYALTAEFHGSWPARLLRGRSPRANERESDSLIKEEKFWVEESYNAANHAAGCTFRSRNEPHLACVRYYIASNPCPFPKPSMFIVPILSSENRNPSSILSAIDLARCIFLVLLSRTARYPCRETVLSLSYL